MAAITPRVYVPNLALRTATVINASSEQAAFPVERIRDSRRSKTWRSLEGFIVRVSVNDAIDWTEAGVPFVALVTPGVYASGASLATEITTQMNAVGLGSWAVTYSSITHLFTFTFSPAPVAIILKWGSGPNAATNIATTIGFATLDSPASIPPAIFTDVSAFAVQKSPATIVVDFGQPETIEAAMAFETEVSGSGTLRVQANTTNSWVSPAFAAVLVAGDPRDPRKYLDFFAPETYQFWRFWWDDVDNPEFSEMGVPFLGPKVEFERAYNLNLAENRRVLSEITQADQGAIFTDVKPHPREWGFRFRDTSDADKDKWDTIEQEVEIGQHLVYALDPLNKPLSHTIYGFVRAPGLTFNHLRTFTDPSAPPEGHWDINFPFSEAIG